MKTIQVSHHYYFNNRRKLNQHNIIEVIIKKHKIILYVKL